MLRSNLQVLLWRSLLLTEHCAVHSPSDRMSNSSEPLVSKETQDAPRYVSSPPPPAPPPAPSSAAPPAAPSPAPSSAAPPAAPSAAPSLVSFKGPPSPPYPAASSKTKMTCIHQPAAGYGSLLDFHTEASTDTTLLMDSSSSDDHKARRAFAKKVFWILTLQLLFSFGVLCASFFVVKDAHNKWLYVGSLLTFCGFTAALSICKSFSQRHPWNVVGWVVVTVSLSHMVGTIGSFHAFNHVFITVGVLMVIAVAIVAFSAQTGYHDVWDTLLLTLTVDVVTFAFLHVLLPLHH
ncbi:protein lifeguard 1-like isoform X2 [Pungitius pungitius]